ncbi:hypothetical protein A7M79_07360 [Acinetobacter baumannii]|uniref:hypothetical protein n=1 Tax=Acinetobacter baumannii TaxID=470 RepID=UPI0008DE60FA|nr:hypothetical protein [Acinetobacter baumannii]OIH08624.1 hypothetical protein A7M79_07360 [Acinetobacter baumannii]
MTKRIKAESIQLSWRGGVASIYSRSHQEHGDYATVCLVHMNCASQGVQNDDYLLVEMRENFNSPENLAIVKAYLSEGKTNVVFADDFEKNALVSADDVLKHCEENNKNLLSFEVEQIKNNPAQLHRITCAAIRANLDDLAYMELFGYDMDKGSLYPYIDAYKSVCAILAARNEQAA